MRIVRGAVACSIAGRDKGNFQVIVEVNGGYAFVCDGKHHPIERPKKKKLKHLSVTNTVSGEENILTNRLIRNTLKSFANKCEEIGFR